MKLNKFRTADSNVISLLCCCVLELYVKGTPEFPVKFFIELEYSENFLHAVSKDPEESAYLGNTPWKHLKRTLRSEKR